MFETSWARSQDEAREAYLRPETGAGIFINFKNVLAVLPQEAAVRDRPDRQVLPQRDHPAATSSSRTCEFEQMEMEFFVPPARRQRSGTSTWMEGAHALVHRPRHPPEKPACCAPTTPDELSHYSSATSDVEYLFPMGWSELEGIANRGDFDLTQHAKFSGEKLEHVDPGSGERYVPYVIEPRRVDRRDRSPS